MRSDLTITPPKSSHAKRHLRALGIAALVAIVLLAPIVYMHYLDAKNDAAREADLGVVPEFLVMDDAGQALSKADFNGNLTIVAWMADVCATAASPGCADREKSLAAFAQWVEAKLLYRDTNEVTPLKMIAVTSPDGAARVPDLFRKISVPAQVAEARLWLPDACLGTTAPVVVIDQLAKRRRCQAFDPKAAQTANGWSGLEAPLSRMTINHYMNDYLVKRTFFRRTPKDDAEERTPPATH